MAEDNNNNQNNNNLDAITGPGDEQPDAIAPANMVIGPANEDAMAPANVVIGTADEDEFIQEIIRNDSYEWWRTVTGASSL